jgi:hypothetical protein
MQNIGLGTENKDNALKTNNINIFPNPAFDKLYITFDNKKISSIKKINIYDFIGSLIKVVNLNENYLPTIEISDIANGVYIAEIIDTENNKFVRKFIKQ